MDEGYKTTGKAVFLTQYHIVWCPKYRRGLLVGKIKERLEEVVREVCLEHGGQVKALEVMPDHVHVFVSCDYRVPVWKTIKGMKGRSSNILRKEFPELLRMPTLWTRSFFLSSIGKVSEATIKRYIERQWKK